MAEFQAARDELAEAGIDVLMLSLDEVDDQDGTGGDAQELAQKIAPGLTHGIASQQTVVAIHSVLDLPFLQHRDLALPLTLLVGDDDRLWAVYRGPVEVERVAEDVRNSQLPYEQRVPIALPFPGKWHRLPPVPSSFTVLTGLVQSDEVDLVAELVQSHRATFQDERGFPQLLAWIGDEQMKRGRVREAFLYYEDSLQLDPRNLMVANNAAWQYATHADHAVRDGAKAVRWATVAAEATKYQNVAVLNTLAAAHAQNGDAAKAVEITERAMALAKQQGDTVTAAKCQQRLDIYRSGKPLP
jgi:tetratricopeptide (TPR) repeat protein